MKINWKLFFLLAITTNCFAKVLILTGPPGSGKGTIAQYFKSEHNFITISSGNLVRREIDNNTKLGKSIKKVAESGSYIEDEIVHNLLTIEFDKALKQNRSFVIDGFPRSKESLDFLLNYLIEHDLHDETLFINLQVPFQILKERILNRIICKKCDAVYNFKTCPPITDGVCNYCFSPLSKRSLDTEEALEKRLSYFQIHIQPVLDLAEKRFITLSCNYSDLQEKLILEIEHTFSLLTT